MKASEIAVDAILYHDPSTRWAEGLNLPNTPKVKVLDPAPRYWAWDSTTNKYRDTGRRSIIATYGILVEILESTHSHSLVGRQKAVALGALRGPYEQIAPKVDEARRVRQGAASAKRVKDGALYDRLLTATDAASRLKITATGLYPFTMVQVSVEQFEAMVSELDAGNWRYEAE
jgi:hypothetical protein